MSKCVATLTFNKGVFLYFLSFFFISLSLFGQTSLLDGNWNTGGTWTGGAVPGPTSTVNAGTSIIVNTNITITSGVYNFGYNGTSNTYSNITDPAGGTAQTLSINNSGGYNAAQGILDIKSGTTTFEGAASFNNANIFVRSGATLILGPTTISSAGKTYITVETGATLIVNGNFTDGNTGGVFTILGFVQVNGNYSTSTGNVVVDATSGSFQTTGSMTTSGSSTVNGTNNDCTTGPCSAAALSCTDSGNTAFTGYITSTPTNKTVCAGGSATLTFNSSALPSPGVTAYQWQSSPDLITINTVSGANAQTYVTPALTADTYYRVLYSVNKNGCPQQTSAWIKISVVTATNTSSQTICSSGTAILSGNQPGTGSTGAWSVVSGPSTLASQFSSVTSYNSGFTPAGGDGSYLLRWTITNTLCSPSSITADATITVLATPLASINIASSTGVTTCAGTNVTFTATPSNGGANPSYQWTKNGSNISGATNSTYTTSSLVGGDVIRCVMTSSYSCATGSPATSNAITVVSANTVTLSSASGTNAQTVCINTAITNITYATTGATGATVTGLPTGVTGNWAGNVITISGTPSVSAVSPYTYTITLTGGCGTVSTTGTITVAPANTVTLSSAASTNAQTICINTPITNITYATTGATGATVTGLPTGVTGNWAGNVITISGTPSVSAVSPYTYTVTLTGGCGTVSTTGTITVTPANTITLSSTAGTNAQTVCINTPITNITYATTGATGATVTGLPTGVTGNWVGNVVTISGTPSISADSPYTYTITLTGGCGTVSTTGTITVTPANTIILSSAVGTDVQTACINKPITNITYTTTGATGATFNGLPTGVTGNWSANVVTISGSPSVSAGSPYTYTVTLTGGCSNVTATGTITISSAQIWIGGTDSNWSNPLNWSCGLVPTSSDDLTIPSGTTFSPSISVTPASVKSLTISTGATLTVSSGATLNVYGNLTNNGAVNLSGILALPSSSGTSVYDADGSGSGVFTVVSTTATQSGMIGAMAAGTSFSGNVVVQRYMGSVVGEQFRYVASPVVNATKPSNLGTLYKYSNGGWTKYNGAMGIGEGYAASTSKVNWAVTGSIHKGDRQWTNLPTGWNLLGNPYPSDIDWKTAGWTLNNISNWSAVTDNQIVGYPNYFHYYDNTAAIKSSIALGQAFWVYVTTAPGSVTITEAAKSATNAATFYREAEKQGPSILEQSFMISMSNGHNSDQTFLLNGKKVPGKSMRQDLTKLFNQEMNIYFLDGNAREMLTHTLSDLPADIKIPVGILVSKAGEYEISFRNTEAFDRPLYLVDQYENETIPVTAGMTYKVTIKDASSAQHERFYLSLSPEVTWNEETSVSVYPNPVKGELTISAMGVKGNSSVTLMDINGRVLISSDFKDKGMMDITNYPAGMYILKVKTEKGLITKKIVKQE